MASCRVSLGGASYMATAELAENHAAVSTLASQVSHVQTGWDDCSRHSPHTSQEAALRCQPRVWLVQLPDKTHSRARFGMNSCSTENS